MNSLCVATVVYDQNPNFVNDYVRSLLSQTDADFDLVLCNDGWPDFSALKSRLDTKRILEATPRQTRFGHRLAMIDAAVMHGYEHLVFYDFDDVMPSDYIAAIRKYDPADYAVSDLSAIDAEGAVKNESIWAERLRKWDSIDASHLKDFNMVGFGNTMLNLQRPWITEFSVDLGSIEIPDWFFYTVNAIKNGFSGSINLEAPMKYRSHAQNFIGLNTLAADRRLKMKQNHYKVLHLELKDYDESSSKNHRVNPLPSPSDFWWE